MSDSIALASSQTDSLLSSHILEPTPGSPSHFSTFREAPNIFLPDPGSDDDFEESTKRRRCADDGRYSSCPSPSGSLCYSPLPCQEPEQPGGRGGSAQYFRGQAELIEKQNIDFNTVPMANLNVLDEGDEEACFGMIKGTIGSTDRALDFMQKLHAERSGEDQCHPLNLELVIRQKEIQVVIDIHATAPLVGYLPHSLSRLQNDKNQEDNSIMDTKDEVSVHLASLSHIFDDLCGSKTQGELPGDMRYLKTPLLKHQEQGLYFLAMREQVKQNSSHHGTYSGGILADYMGLGKTLTILSLIVSYLDEARVLNTRNGLLSVHEEKIRSGATLIVAPVSVLGNWEEQIAVHIQPKALRYFVYYGKNKPTDPQLLSQYDIVFTSFQTLTQEWSKPAQNSSSCGPLYTINWFRVILDEAHEIRTPSTIKCQAACAISADRRWCITGTPLQNDITDIATLFKFLRLGPLNTKQDFDRYITAKLKAGDASGMKTLRGVLRQMCLRRAKDTISDRLPARNENIKYLKFNDRERILYDSHKQKLSTTANDACDSTFQVILRLRLICDHGKDLLPQGDLEIRCSTCHMQLRDWEMDAGRVSCVHSVICQRCINARAIPEDVDTFGPGCPSTYRFNKNLHKWDMIKCEPVSKHVVFSSWTRMLDLVGFALASNNIMFCRLDGSMPRSKRNNTLSEFSTNPQVIVILVSLMAGGVGINLTCASRVHVLEPHWNPMIEQQAVERVHRLGQRRDVTITRYIMKDSFEIDMMRYQDRKILLARQSLDSHIDPDAMEICTAEGGS
ncbi:uncharacterized protein LAJ45_11635 [Morchella importuna]|uniref:uncharacterized protein n=1 Tax=Morchella importuna TaxID=1174673 RepID=UPI001E8DADFD|nr:uncharacterized protein LAJ45_11635 [Morchella importuna]KAH8144389.1 hypothetical protein LAJ45_11635 [Morchella importuna]